MSPAARLRPLRAAGERVRVSTVEPEDLGPYRVAVTGSLTRLSRWNPASPDDLAFHLAKQSSTHRTFMIRALEPLRGADHELVGKVNVTNVVRGRLLGATIGYDAYDPYVGQGLFREGLSLVLGLALAREPEGMGLHRIEANVQPGNVVSAAVLRSLGFAREGFSRQYLHLDDGSGRPAWRDHDRYALVRRTGPGGDMRGPLAVVVHLPSAQEEGSGAHGDSAGQRLRVARRLAAELGVSVVQGHFDPEDHPCGAVVLGGEPLVDGAPLSVLRLGEDDLASAGDDRGAARLALRLRAQAHRAEGVRTG